MTTKDLVIDLVKGMPPKISMSDIVYRLHVIDEIKKGEVDIKEGRLIPQTKMRPKIKKWK
jgi:predicted transcriptional regulator